MKHKIPLALFLLSSLVVYSTSGCQSAGWCAFATAANKAGYAISNKLLGGLSGPEPNWGQVEEDCIAGIDRTPTQPDDPLDYTSFEPTPGICGHPYDGTDPCAACVRPSCCAESLACAGEQTCLCNLAKKMKIAWPKEVSCAEPDAAYDAVTACLDARCAEECYP